MSGMKKKDEVFVWVLTREHNDYDQYGEYFEAVFTSLPSLEKLAGFFKSSEYGLGYSNGDVFRAIEFLEHLLKGGGRMGNEDVWFNLRKIKCD